MRGPFHYCVQAEFSSIEGTINNHELTLIEGNGFSGNSVQQMCQALAYLHGLNHPIIHRDLKPWLGRLCCIITVISNMLLVTFILFICIVITIIMIIMIIITTIIITITSACHDHCHDHHQLHDSIASYENWVPGCWTADTFIQW